jgi:hypothetical protein
MTFVVEEFNDSELMMLNMQIMFSLLQVLGPRLLAIPSHASRNQSN